MIDTLAYVVQKLKDNNGFSNTFIKNIDREFRPLLDNAQKYSEDHMIETEINRLLARSAMAKNKEQREKEIMDLIPVIMRLYDHRSDITNTANFFSALHICDFIKRETFDEYNHRA